MGIYLRMVVILKNEKDEEKDKINYVNEDI